MPIPPFLENLTTALGPILSPFFEFILSVWWLWTFIILAVLTATLLKYYRSAVFKKAIQWSLLEIRIPREVKKSPRAMEQVLNQIYSLRNIPENVVEKYVEGEVTLWFSLEIVSFGGEVHFFIRTPTKYKDIIESTIYANYQDTEVVEVADYIDRLPAETTDLYKQGLEFFGIELTLGLSDVYPIKTHMQFETLVEEQAIDPIAGLIEILSKLKKEEQIWIQMLVSPADPMWKLKGKKLIQELKEKTIGRAKIGGEGESVTIARSPGETALLETIEKSIAKSGFDTIIRYIYFAPRSIYNYHIAYRGVRSAFAQYSAQNLNFFLPNIRVRTMVGWLRFPFLFAKRRQEARKQRVLDNYRSRSMPEELLVGKILNSHPLYFDNKSRPIVLTTEELATLYHPPSFLVLTAPFIKRVEAKRLGPPAGLQIFGEHEELPGLVIEGGETTEGKEEIDK